MDDWQARAKLAMKEAGITQDQLAEQLEMTQGGVQHWLAGTRQPSLAQINRIADILKVSRAWLTHGVSSKDHLPVATKTWRERAREHMKATGVTQERLAEHLEMTPAGVQKWLAGTRHPTLESIEQIADFLSVPRAWLTHGLTAEDQLTGLPTQALAVLRRLVQAERAGIAPPSLWPAISSITDMALGHSAAGAGTQGDPGDDPPQVLPEAQAIIEERVREAQHRREQTQQSPRPAQRRAT